MTRKVYLDADSDQDLKSIVTDSRQAGDPECERFEQVFRRPFRGVFALLHIITFYRPDQSTPFLRPRHVSRQLC
jgi:hypothetical protein